jgi:hypothetical protein
MHIYRLRSVKSMLDNRAPKSYAHLQPGKKGKPKVVMNKFMEM